MVRYRADANEGGTSGLGVSFLVGAVAGVFYYFISHAGSTTEEQLAANQFAGGALVIQQSSQVYDAMIRYLNDGRSSRQMTLDSDQATGIFSDYLEAGRPPVPHPGFFEQPEIYNSRWMLTAHLIPENQRDDWYGVVLPGIKKSLCQKLNAILHKDDVNTEPVVSVYTKEQWVSARVELQGSDPRLARRDGCAAASDGGFVFYRVMVRR